MQRDVQIVCSACLTEACAQGIQLCEESRKASFTITHALHEDGCPICRTATAITRSILEAVCRRDGISLESGVEPGHPARNYELAERLGIPNAFRDANIPCRACSDEDYGPCTCKKECGSICCTGGFDEDPPRAV